MNTSDALRFLVLRTIGNFLLLFAIYGVFATFGPALFYEAQYQVIKMRGIQYTVASAQEVPKTTGFGEILKARGTTREANGFSQVLNGPKDQVLVAKDTDFSIFIPKIGANAKIFSNVDPANEQEFLPILQKGVAHAKGSVFPGITGNTYLFAHSTDNFWDAGRYNAVFYLLKDLSIGDNIVVFFENVRHDYAVSDTKIVDPTDVSHLVKSQESGKEQLVMQTCWPPGTTWKRLLVFATPK